MPTADWRKEREFADSDFTSSIKSSLKDDINTANMSMEQVNGMTLVTESLKDSSGAFYETTRAFSSLNEAIAKLGSSTISALQTKQREQEFEKANPQYEAIFNDKQKPKVDFEVRSAQEIDAKISDSSIEIFRDILTGTTYASNVGFTGGGQATEAANVAYQISDIMQEVQNTFGYQFADKLSSALPAFGGAASQEVQNLSKVMQGLKQVYERKGKGGSELEIRKTFDYLKNLGDRALGVSTQTGSQYQPQAQQFVNATAKVQSNMGPSLAQYNTAAQTLTNLSTKFQESVTAIMQVETPVPISTESTNTELQNLNNEISNTITELSSFEAPESDFDAFNNEMSKATENLQSKINDFSLSDDLEVPDLSFDSFNNGMLESVKDLSSAFSSIDLPELNFDPLNKGMDESVQNLKSTTKKFNIADEIEFPTVEIPKIEFPTVEIPEIEISEIEMPDIDTSEIDISEIDIPEIDIDTEVINEQLNSMLHKIEFKEPEIHDENPVLVMIMTESGIPLYTKIFDEQWSVNEELFSGFLSAFNSFSDEIFSKGFDRAVFGDYAILMRSLNPFMISYIFKGQSYLAKQRFSKFTENIQKTESIITKLNHSMNTGLVLKSSDVPNLEELLSEMFISRKI